MATTTRPPAAPEVTTAPVEVPHDAPAKERLSLLIISEGTFTTCPLPEIGEIAIGRGDEADVKIAETWISRRHAIIRVGQTLQLQDLGSSNGTRLRGEQLEPNQVVDFSPGDVIELGKTMLTVQRHAAPPRPRRLRTHAYFEGRLDEECARGARFAMLRVQVADVASNAAVHTVLAGALRSQDVMATYAPGEYEILLIDAERAEADRIAGVIREAAQALGGNARVGIACCPTDGRDPETLVARAGTRSAPAEVVTQGRMQDLRRLLERVAAGNINVLLLGETGVGKEVMAELVHARSPRSQKPFLRLNCAALSESLLESELFGHERGAFTGAVQTKPGLLETADGGSVFLDEIGELPAALQVKLLRATEERQVLRVGGVKPRPIDVRFISATNRDLEADVSAQRFRPDLFFRLNGVSIVIPPLRERTSEIDGLARSFVAQACRASGREDQPVISAPALAALQRYGWPGNIRELRNVIERAVLLCVGDEITPEHLPLEKMSTALAPASSGRVVGSLRDDIEDVERGRILDALERCEGNRSQAARMLGISRNTLLARLRNYGL